MLEIELKNITKSYKDFKAVDDVSFTIRRGESVGLVGESGCGKSTIASLIAGLDEVDGGEICFNGQTLQSLKGKDRRRYHQHVQMVFQDTVAALNPRWTAGASISEPIENFLNLNKQERQALVYELLEQVGLTKADYHKVPRQFSGGQRQRIAIARAIAIKPEFLLLDEVTSSLDVSIQAQILNLLVRLKKEFNMGFLLISHDFGVVRYMCDQILIMYRGRIVEEISTENLKHVQHPYSKLLLASVPSIHRKLGPAEAPVCIRGEAGESHGCQFYNRCPLRQDECQRNVPPLEEISADHKVACFEVK